MHLGPQSLALSCDDHIATVGQGTVGQGLESLAPHDDRVAGGQLFEMGQVFGQMPGQLIVIANGPAWRHGHNDADQSVILIFHSLG